MNKLCTFFLFQPNYVLTRSSLGRDLVICGAFFPAFRFLLSLWRVIFQDQTRIGVPKLLLVSNS